MAITKEQAVLWVNGKIGQRIDIDNFAGAQCMDLIVAFCNEHFGWWPKGNARDLAYQALPSGFKRFKKTPGFLPLPGDIFVWDHDQYGHTGIITSATLTGYTSVEQNGQSPYDGSGPARAYSRGYANFWGVIRPPYQITGKVTMQCIYWKPNSKGTGKDAYYFNGVSSKYIPHPDSVSILKTIYKDNHGKNIPEYQWGNAAPWWVRLEAVCVKQ